MSQYHRFNGMKILAHAGRLRQVAEYAADTSKPIPYPLDWHVYPSNFCNHTCDWCMFRQNNEQFIHRDMLSPTVLTNAVMDAARTGAVLMHFSGGGEPLLNKSTLPAMRLAGSLGLAVALSTNGALLTPEVAAEVDYIRVSLNAGTKDQHDKTNHPHDGGSDWCQILQNLKAAVPVRRKDIGLAYVVDHENYKDIPAFCQVADEIGVDFVHIRPAFWYDKKLDDATRAIMPEAFALCEQAKASARQVQIFAISDKFDGYWSDREYDQCLAVLTGTCLTATGDFAVCQDRTDLRFGAAYATGARFEEIWQSQEHRELVSTIVSPGTLDACPRCVWNNRNQIIQDVFIKDEMRLDLI